ncbi:MAG: aminomethyl-transferring glycine dehydrogenase subunit GcvPA [Clostridia bacterium]|nr:aminomethyl-transferring glycine dehydrogenase subunit GcvPA [Clostridia bacterium]
MAKYTPHTSEDVRDMLQRVGVESVKDLFNDVDKSIRRTEPLNIPEGVSQFEAYNKFKSMAKKNVVIDTILRGAGSYDHFIPPTLPALVNRSEFLTAYTPYQPEISQGILQSIFEYQSYMCMLTGMDISNASVYDGATACAEAMHMCCDKKRKMIIAGAVNPQYTAVIETYATAGDFEIVCVPEGSNGKIDLCALENAIDDTVAGVYAQSPNYFGLIEDMKAVGALTSERKVKFVYIFNPVAAALLPTAAADGADIAVGEGQPLGISMGFGGPYLGIMTCKTAMQRRMPGRIVGETVDNRGNKAYVLTLQAREQHIRREKALSSICSNEAHCALTATVYLSLMGKEFINVAKQSVSKAHYFMERLTAIDGFTLKYKGEFFHEFVTECKLNVAKLNKRLLKEGCLGGLELDERTLLWCVTEKPSIEQLDTVIKVIKEVASCN